MKQDKKDRLNKVYKDLYSMDEVKSKGDFAKQLKIDDSYLSSMFSGKLPVTENVLEKLSEKFGISINWMVDGAGNMYTKDETGFNEPNVKVSPTQQNHAKLGDLTVDNMDISVLPLIPRKTKHSLYTNGNVNRPLFETIIPDNNNTRGYVPFYANASDILSSYTDLSTLKNEAMSKVWLETPLIDDVFRVAYESSFCTRYMHDNMGADVPLGSKITAKFKQFKTWRPGSLYAIFFVDGEMFIYGLSEGKDERHVLLIDGKKGTKNQLIEDILCIAIVQEVIHPK